MILAGSFINATTGTSEVTDLSAPVTPIHLKIFNPLNHTTTDAPVLAPGPACSTISGQSGEISFGKISAIEY